MSETDKANTVAFHKKAVFEGDVENAFRTYAGSPYRQHNPLIEEGMDGLRKFVAWMRANRPDAHGEIKRVFADGDYVILHSYWHGLSDSPRGEASLTSIGWKTVRWPSTGMSSSRSRRRLRITTRCSDPPTTNVAAEVS
jgi:predicted SnoaL-like aldol condensation-catalyzing enzyme